LGRQGSPRLAAALEGALAARGIPCTRVLLSEVHFVWLFGCLGRWGALLRVLEAQHATQHITPRHSRHNINTSTQQKQKTQLSPAKLEALGRAGIEAWAQVACPRLSIDWGEGFRAAPVLTPYEAMVALGEARPWWEQEEGEDGDGQGGGGGGDGGSGLVAVAPRGSGAGRLAQQQQVQQQQQQQQPCSGGGGDGVKGGGGTEEDVDVMRGRYPMDYYARDGGPWNGSYHRRA
jgi:2-(3-amino-3-carboxypropyl)histidine synthase